MESFRCDRALQSSKENTFFLVLIPAVTGPTEDERGGGGREGMTRVMRRREGCEVEWRGRLERAADEGLALESWLGELALSHTATLEWMGCSDGCLNRLIVLASQEIGTDG